MLTLYTAIGYLKMTKNGEGIPTPAIMNNGQECRLSEHELAIWSCLAFQILHAHELEPLYAKYRTAMKHPDAQTFAGSLNRLLLRGLVAKGTGLTGIDALYQLLGELYIHPVKDNWLIRLLTCLKLTFKGKLPFSSLASCFHKKPVPPLEKMVLKLSARVPLSTAELLSCFEHNINKSGKLLEALDTLYDNDSVTYQTLAEDAQIHHLQLPVLQAVGNLYLNQQILFQHK